MQKESRKFVSCQVGMTLVEIVIAVALLGVAITGLVAGLSASSLSGSQVEERSLATNLARSQLENIKAQPYVEPPEYSTITPPEGYSITVNASVNTTGLLEVITVSVSNPEKTLIEVTGYKVNMAAVTTTAPAVTIASDDFENDDWEGGSGWLDEWHHSGDASIRSGDDPYEGSYHLRLRRSNGYVDRAVNLSGQTDVHLQFWAKVDSFEGSDFAEALVSPDDVNWTVVKTWTASDSDNAYHSVDIDLSGFTMSSEFWIAFDAEMNAKNDRLYIDDLKIVSQ